MGNIQLISNPLETATCFQGCPREQQQNDSAKPPQLIETALSGMNDPVGRRLAQACAH
jgi:hypothetical protein